MRALMKVAKGVGFVEVRDIPKPVIPEKDWVLIKVKAASVCGTDLHIYHDKFNRYRPPVVLGHEFSGVIEEVGSAVKNVKPGDRVVAEPQTGACGVCHVCREGKLGQCPDKKTPGWGTDGAFADYLVMPAFLMHKIPDGLSDEIAALTEPVAVCVHEVLERGRIECQDFVVVTGSGPIGIIAAFVAKAAGASRVAMTGMNIAEYCRFDIAKKLGVDHIINVEKENPVERVMELTNGRGADIVIEASGAGPAIAQVVDLVRYCGRICAIGLSNNEFVNFQWNKAMDKTLQVIFNFSSSYSSWDRALSLLANTKVDLNQLITHKSSIENWESVFRDLEAEKGAKALFIPGTL